MNRTKRAKLNLKEKLKSEKNPFNLLLMKKQTDINRKSFTYLEVFF